MKFKKHFLSSLLYSALLCMGAGAANAAMISEAEASNTSGFNDTSATAQALNMSDFTANSDANVFGTLPTVSINGAIGAADDIDFFSFMGLGGETTYFDIDNTSGPDTFLSLFDFNGTLIAGGEDSPPADAGSSTDVDAFTGVFSLPADGTYYIAVSQSGNNPNATNDDNALFPTLNRPDGEPSGGFAVSGAAPDQTFTGGATGATGAYTLNFSRSVVPAPEPGTMSLMAIGLASLGAATRKRKKAARDAQI